MAALPCSITEPAEFEHIFPSAFKPPLCAFCDAARATEMGGGGSFWIRFSSSADIWEHLHYSVTRNDALAAGN